MIRYAFLLSMVCLFYSCQQPAKQKETERESEPRQPAVQKTDTAKYSMMEFKRISPYFQQNEEQLDTTYFEVFYPKFENPVVDSFVQKNLLVDGESTLDEASDSFLSGYNEFVEDNDDRISKAAWFKKVNLTIHVNSPKVISISNFTYEFTGGAHGNYYSLWTNYDPVNNEKIELKSIIPEYKRKDLVKIAEKHFRMLEKLSDTASYGNDYFFDNHQFTLTENFGLLKDSIIFYYNPYEIKSYADGPTALKIPYDSIKDLFNSKGLNYIKSIEN